MSPWASTNKFCGLHCWEHYFSRSFYSTPPNVVGSLQISYCSLVCWVIRLRTIFLSIAFDLTICHWWGLNTGNALIVDFWRELLSIRLIVFYIVAIYKLDVSIYFRLSRWSYKKVWKAVPQISRPIWSMQVSVLLFKIKKIITLFWHLSYINIKSIKYKNVYTSQNC